MKMGTFSRCCAVGACIAMLSLTACGEDKAADESAKSVSGSQSGQAAEVPAADKDVTPPAGGAAGKETAAPADSTSTAESADKQSEIGSGAAEAPTESGAQPAGEAKDEAKTETGEVEAKAGAGSNTEGKSGESMSEGGEVSQKDLLHRRFELRTVNGKEYALQGARPNISFNENFHVSGSVCNGFMGPGTLENGVLSAKNMAATRKLCITEELNKLEADFFALMRNGASVELDGQRLVLRGKGREDDLVLEYTVKDLVQ